ncbi:MAG: single-stranded DNA-binding protein [Methylococcus sp.]
MLNRAELIGRLGRDPDVRYTQEGKAIVNLALATSDVFRDKTSGEKREETEWHRVVLFGKQAEIASQFLKKGSLAYIDGRLRTRQWKNKEGLEQTTTEIVGNSLSLLERKGSSGKGSSTAPESIGHQEDGGDDLPDMPF